MSDLTELISQVVGRNGRVPDDLSLVIAGDVLTEIAPDLARNIKAPYLGALWAIWDLCEIRMEMLRATDDIYSPEADTLEEIIKVLVTVPGLLPKPPRGRHD